MLNIEVDTVRFYVFGENGSGSNENCWYQIKKRLGPSTIAAYLHDKIGVLDKICGTATNIVTLNLSRLHQEMLDDPTKVLSLDDTKKLSGIYLDMDKVIRLESGQATQIIENIGLSRAEAIRVLSEDPFAQDVEVDQSDITYLDHPENKKEEIIGDVNVSRPWDDE